MNYSMLALLALLAFVSGAHACGEQVMSQNFDKYSEGYTTWTKEMGKEDFDEKLIFLKKESVVSAGGRNLRAKNPEGTICHLCNNKMAYAVC